MSLQFTVVLAPGYYLEVDGHLSGGQRGCVSYSRRGEFCGADPDELPDFEAYSTSLVRDLPDGSQTVIDITNRRLPRRIDDKVYQAALDAAAE